MVRVSGPVLLLVVPLLGAVLAWLLSRWPRWTVVVGTVTAWLLGLWLWRLPLADVDEVMVYGRALTLTLGIQSLLGLLLFSLGGLFLLSLLWPQGRYFVPASLAALAPMAAALLIRPLTLSALFWLIAVIFLGVVIQSERAGRTQAAWRYVLLTSLAVLLLLAGGWMAEAAQTALHEMAGRLLAVAFLILLAGFPFHIWLQPVVTAGMNFDRPGQRGLVLVVVLGLGQLVVTVFVYAWLRTYPWLGAAAPFRQLVQWSSGLTALTAGVLALTAQSRPRLLGSLLLLDMSVAAALLLVPVAVGWSTAVLLPLARTVSLLLVSLGWSSLGGDTAWQGAGRRRPGAALTLGYGLISLLGLPLTVGFAGRWAAVALVAQQADVAAWLPISLLLAMGGGIVGTWRGLGPLLARGEAEGGTAVLPLPSMKLRLGLWVSLVIGGLLAVTPLGFNAVRRLADLWLSVG